MGKYSEFPSTISAQHPFRNKSIRSQLEVDFDIYIVEVCGSKMVGNTVFVFVFDRVHESSAPMFIIIRSTLQQREKECGKY